MTMKASQRLSSDLKEIQDNHEKYVAEVRTMNRVDYVTHRDKWDFMRRCWVRTYYWENRDAP